MKVALGELRKGVHEQAAAADFQAHLLATLTAGNPRGPTLLDWNAIDRKIVQQASDSLGSTLMRIENSEIVRYLDTVRTDPDLNRYHRAYALDPTRKNGSEWRMTAWCAAFVNWCLTRVGAPHLGIATAASWLAFGMPLACPTYGCITVIKPGSNTGSTTGHVAFCGGPHGSKIWLLGGNQSRRVSWMLVPASRKRGYRWPYFIGDFDEQTLRRGSRLV